MWEIIQITVGPPLWLHWKPDSKTGRRKLKCSGITLALSRLMQSVNISAIFNYLRLLRFILTQNDMVVYHS